MADVNEEKLDRPMKVKDASGEESALRVCAGLTGRTPIYTDKTTEELSDLDTMLKELDRVFEIHWYNVQSIRFLNNYYKGIHPAILFREKKVRPEIDNKVVINYAYSSTRDITGYFLGKNIRYVQQGSREDIEAEGFDDLNTTNDDNDASKVPNNDINSGVNGSVNSGKEHNTSGGDKPNDTQPPVGVIGDKGIMYKKDQVESLNHIFDLEDKQVIDFSIATDMSICGVGYKGVFIEDNAINDTCLKLSRLDPEHTYVVYSSGDIKTPMFAVSYWTNNVKYLSDKKTFIRVYTQVKQYDFMIRRDFDAFAPICAANGFELIEEKPIWFNGSLPIVEYPNNSFRMGDWETAIPIMDGIDTLSSDGVNDIEQYVQNILVAIGMEFDETTQQTLNDVGVLNIPQVPPDVKTTLEYITPQLDSTGAYEMREYLESCLRVVVGIPDRKTRGGGGGDTGDAVFMRDGWQDIDLVASTKEASFIKAERQALNVALYILQTNDELETGLSASDIEIKFNRYKTANIQSKAQVLQGLWNILDPYDALDICDITTNVGDVVKRAEAYQNKKLQRQLIEQEKVSEVAAKFDKKNEDVNTGTPKKDNVDDKKKDK